MGRNTFESEVTISINVDDLKGFVEEKMFNEFLKRCWTGMSSLWRLQ